MDKEILNKIIKNIEEEYSKYDDISKSDDDWMRGYLTGLNAAKLKVYEFLHDE